MSTNTRGREFTHIGIIINKNIGSTLRYRFLMRRKDSITDEKYLADVWLSQELFGKIISDNNYITRHYCYFQRNKFDNRFEMIQSKFLEKRWVGSSLYFEQLITMRDNVNGIEYEFDTRDRYQEVGLNNIPKASQYVETIQYEDIEFEKVSLIKANYPTGKETSEEKELSIMDVIAALTDTERKTIIDRLTKKCKELTESIGLNELMAKFHGSK